MTETTNQPPQGDAGAPQQPSALSNYFHVGLKGGPQTRPPVYPSGGKAPHAGAHVAFGQTGSLSAPGHDGPHHQGADVHGATGSGTSSRAGSVRGLGSRAPTSRATTAAGTMPPATEASHAASQGGPRLKPSSQGVARALNAVLNKKEAGIRGLSAGPDESLAKDKVNKDVLMKMRETFARADKDGTGELSTEEFCASFAGVLHTEDGSDEEALAKLFMRIDANSDGSVNWDEFCSYMLLESQGAANLRDLENSISFDDPADWTPPEGCEHDKLITHITRATLPNGSDRYVTCGRDGVVKVWNAKDLKLMRTVTVGKSWVTAAKVLPSTRKLAVTSFSRSMKIYDLQTFEVCGQIPEIEYAPMAMDAWTPARHREVEMVAFGDGGGFVRLYELRLNPLEQKTSSDRYLDNVKWKHQHHTDWVTCIKYVEELNTVVAGSLDKTISLTDADDRVGVKTLQGHVKGVCCLDWSPVYKFIVSGSQDRRVMLWNPFSQKPLATLLGHTASVTAVCVNDRDNQIVSLGADKQVKLWDIRNHKCIQTLTDHQEVPGAEENTLLCATYDHKQKALITGALWPKVWRQTITASASCGHRDPVVRILFNPLFNEAVSADASGIVSVWYVPTGKLRFRFGDTHPKRQLTAINFDAQKRRLLTGADNGEVKVWNFSSGACLCVLRPRTHEEVTSILTIRGALFKHFVVAGWDRKVTCFEDPGPEAKETTPGRVINGHKADILDMAVMSNNQLVSVADDGEVCAWNMESGTLRKRMTPPGHQDLPMNEQAIERIQFLSGKLHHVFVTVGADRWLRLWDAASHSILLELFTGHIAGETVMGLAVHPENQAVATGDASGIVKVWDISRFTGKAVPDLAAARELVPERALWRAHKAAITSMDWVHVKEGDFVLTSSMDRTVSLWSMEGAFVGQFGACVWLLDSPGSWRSTTAYDLDARDLFELETSKAPPKRTGLDEAVSSPVSCAEANSGPDSPPRHGQQPQQMQYQQRQPLALAYQRRPSAVGGSPLISARSNRMSRTFDKLASGLESCLRSPEQQPVQRMSRVGVSLDPTKLESLVSPSQRASKVNIVLEPPTLESYPSRRASRVNMLQRASVSGKWGTGASRPTTAPDDVARVLVASHHDRLRHVKSMRMKERPEEFGPGGRYSRPGSAWSQCGGVSGQSRQGRPPSDDSWNLIQGSGSSGSSSEHLASESASDDKHSSDDDVPNALWLEQFQMARRAQGHLAAEAIAATQQPRRQRGNGRKGSPGRKDGRITTTGARSTATGGRLTTTGGRLTTTVARR